MTTTTNDPNETEMLVAALADATAVLRAAQQRVDSIKGLLRAAVPPGTHQFGAHKLRVTTPRRFIEAKAIELFDADQRARFVYVQQVEKVDREQLQQELPELYEMALEAQTPAVALV